MSNTYTLFSPKWGGYNPSSLPSRSCGFVYIRHRRRGGGIYILYEDVKSCPYEDVHVLWSILVDSHTPAPPPPK
ncbi:hypothetical protein OROGR_014303 [Orobanche gracilis]